MNEDSGYRVVGRTEKTRQQSNSVSGEDKSRSAARRRHRFVVRPALVFFTVAIVVIATLMATSVLASRPNEVRVASLRVMSLESALNALGVRDASVRPAGAGALVGFIRDGQRYNLQVISAGGEVSITETPRLAASGESPADPAMSSASRGIGEPVGTAQISAGPADFCCGGGGGGPEAYSVYIYESGLPSGASWNVTVKDGSSEYFMSDTTVDYEFDVLYNGTYSFQGLAAVGTYGYYAAEGSFKVSGKSITIDTSFTKVTSDPSGISTACWIAIVEAFAGSIGLIAAAVACATTGVGCLVFLFLLDVEGIAIPTSVAVNCGI